MSTSLLCSTCGSTFKEKKIGMCRLYKKVKPKNTNMEICYDCHSTVREQKYGRFQQNFKNWTSGNDNVDKFIQNIQLSASNEYQLLEWIPYDRFCRVEYVAKGGFAKIFKASWKDNRISHWNVSKNIWERHNSRNKVMALKSLNNSQNVTLEFIKEITSYVKLAGFNLSDEFIRCYGINQDPITKDYIMVMKYAEFGNLRNYLDKRYRDKKISRKVLYAKLRYKVRILRDIAVSLKRIHIKGIIHRDLHIGNIVCSKKGIYITDMGLCKPVNYTELDNTENNAYGVLPYVAPEVLRGEHYTQASDIYSFGIIMYKIISELPPYYDVSHDEFLAI
ncbi:hypothetical protein RclHR1_08840005 [Rhizophagus clarus]|uniref:Protein kinase domain-containing protein n=1 Tax=Rhizophagus clarus TaxID=94130 RepID=A0A2Z6S2H1_9GLOM|nr:hypothetical protein RclHR1_08840005 [Rhizophagus clarus]